MSSDDCFWLTIWLTLFLLIGGLSLTYTVQYQTSKREAIKVCQINGGVWGDYPMPSNPHISERCVVKTEAK